MGAWPGRGLEMIDGPGVGAGAADVAAVVEVTSLGAGPRVGEAPGCLVLSPSPGRRRTRDSVPSTQHPGLGSTARFPAPPDPS